MVTCVIDPAQGCKSPPSRTASSRWSESLKTSKENGKDFNFMSCVILKVFQNPRSKKERKVVLGRIFRESPG